MTSPDSSSRPQAHPPERPSWKVRALIYALATLAVASLAVPIAAILFLFLQPTKKPPEQSPPMTPAPQHSQLLPEQDRPAFAFGGDLSPARHASGLLI